MFLIVEEASVDTANLFPGQARGRAVERARAD